MGENGGYEMSDPFTVGGNTGRYFIASPWNTECEWTLVSATAVGLFGSIGIPIEVNVPASAGPTTLFTGNGVLTSVLVTATGAADLEFTDAAGNVIAEVPSTATLDQVFSFNEAFNVSLVAQNSATTPVVTATYTPLTAVQGSATFSVSGKNSNVGVPPTSASFGGPAAPYGSINSGADNNNALPCFIGVLTPTTPFVPFSLANFMPLASPPYVFIRTACPSNTQVYVTVQFRRLLDRVIPDKPRQKPQTHTHVNNRRAHRTMMEGFAAQYPEEAAAYQHQPLPEQDTGMARRGVFPMGPLQPTNNQHRGVGGKNGRQR